MVELARSPTTVLALYMMFVNVAVSRAVSHGVAGSKRMVSMVPLWREQRARRAVKLVSIGIPPLEPITACVATRTARCWLCLAQHAAVIDRTRTHARAKDNRTGKTEKCLSDQHAK